MKLLGRRIWARAILATAMTLAFASAAHAVPTVIVPPPPPPLPTQATIDVMLLLATSQPGPGSISPAIGNLPQLRRPPFSAYNTYTLLAKQSMTLVKGAPVIYRMINGRDLQITLNNVTPGPRYEIAAAINQPGGGAYLNLLRVTVPPNDTFFVAGQQYQGGVIIIGFTVH